MLAARRRCTFLGWCSHIFAVPTNQGQQSEPLKCKVWSEAGLLLAPMQRGFWQTKSGAQGPPKVAALCTVGSKLRLLRRRWDPAARSRDPKPFRCSAGLR